MNASKTPPQAAGAAANGTDWRIDRERAVALFGAHAHD
jgi:BirA family transcriptional regulator, biotin operon repressor / biotin---[acetyl-CoA-carboxylase] ligase